MQFSREHVKKNPESVQDHNLATDNFNTPGLLSARAIALLRTYFLTGAFL